MRPVKEIQLTIVILFISFAAFIYLYGFADRKVVFLYEHLGLTPFDSTTKGRYWMSGFVLSGFLSILYLFIQLFILFISKTEQIKWQTVLKFLWIPLMCGIIMITMTLGEPKMPFSIALSSAVALLTGLIIGFSVTDDLVKDYKSTIIYLITGSGLVPFIIFFRVLELPSKGILEMKISVLVVLITITGGFIWLLISNRIFKQNKPELINIIKGTLAIAYIGLPVLHYLAATPEGIPYITSSDNFFADNMILRITDWILLVLIVFAGKKIF